MKMFTPFRFISIFAFIAFIFHFSNLAAQPAGGKWAAASQLPLLTNARLLFVDSLLGYYIGQDTGYVTKDGALTWTQMSFPSDARPAPTYLFAPDHNTVILFQAFSTDSNGVAFPGVIKSTDMGSSWNLVLQTSIPFATKALTMWTANDGFRIWLDNSNKDYCAVTHDGGVTFADIRGDTTLEKYISKLEPPTSLKIQYAWSDELHGAISVSGDPTTPYPMLLTSDGGKTWREEYLKFNGDSAISHSYVYMLPGTGSIWVLPTNPNQAHFFYYSSDYGSSWTTTDTLARTAFNGPYILKIAPVSPTAAWEIMVGNDRGPSTSQNVIDFKDISGKWIQDTSFGLKVHNNFSWHFNEIHFTDQYHGWVLASQTLSISSGQTVIDTAFIFRFRTTPQNSVRQISENSNLKCIPNPASSSIRIEGFTSDEKINGIKLINTLGNQFSRKMEYRNSGIELDVSGIPNGCYILSINTSLRKESIPVMVVH